MSFRALFAAWATPTRTANGFAVMVALAGHHNDETGMCCPSQVTLAARTKLSTDTVGRAVKELEAEGLIARHVRKHPTTGARLSDRYDLLFASPRQLSLLLAQQADAEEAGGQDRNLRGGDLADLAGGGPKPHTAEGGPAAQGEGAPRTQRSKSGRESGKVSSGAGAPAMPKAQVEALWAAIPDQRPTKADPGLPDIRKRSESKGEVAKAAQARINDGETFERLLAGLTAYYADPDVQRANYQYAIGAQRVLRKGIWLTYLEAVEPEEDPDDLFAAPSGPVHVDYVADWQADRWLAEWSDAPGTWRVERGPPPGSPGCRIHPDALRRHGVTPHEETQP